MMHWFGDRDSFGPVRDTNPQADVPVNERCMGCDQNITAKDSGIFWPAEDPMDNVVYHLECFLIHVIGR